MNTGSKKPRILKPKFNIGGYLVACLSKSSQLKYFPIHRLVARLFIPNPEGKPQVNHVDGNKFNNFVDNLEWCTCSENIQHAFATGLTPQGEDRSDTKLTNEQVRYIRDNPDRLSIAELAKMFGVRDTTISRIQTGKRRETVGGVLRQAKKQKYTPRISEDVRQQIKAEYVRNSSEYGCYGLAKKYGIGRQTILNIIHEQR